MFPCSPVAKAAVVAALAASALLAVDTSKLKPSGYVNDFAHVMDAASRQRLENYLGEVERSTGAEIAIVTIDTLDGEPVEDVANRLYHQWGIGKKGKDEGILLLLAIKDHKQRAEIGLGLEPVITDGDAGEVLRRIRPILRQGNYGGALLAAAQQFGDRIAQSKGVNLSPLRTVRTGRTGVQRSPIPWPLVVVGILVLISFLSSIGRGGRGGGGGTGFLAGMFLGNMMGRGGSGWGSGGGFGGGGSSGGGFGGFGGGDSGGGGASSDW
jgi:uncharacterized protein